MDINEMEQNQQFCPPCEMFNKERTWNHNHNSK